MAERIMMSDEEMEQVTGGNIQISTQKQMVRNSTNGQMYSMTGKVDAKTIADWVYANYGKFNDDADVIAALQAKEWIS